MVMKQRGARLESLSRVSRGVLAPDQTEVTPAQTTPVGLNEPVERSFESVLRSDGSEIDGFAVRAPVIEHCVEHHLRPPLVRSPLINA